MVYYKPVNTTIDATELVEIIIIVMIKDYSLSELIVSNKEFLFTSKF